MRRVLEQAGGVYVKLGQIAATRVDIIPAEICDELAILQNRVTAEPKERIAPFLESELGASVDEVFAEFDWEPLAAASIGQTYRARLHSGENVVVKVQRPDIEELMERDLAALALLADIAQRRTQFGQGVRSGELLAQFAEGLRAEIDFRHEMDAMEEMAMLLDGRSGVRVARGVPRSVRPDGCSCRNGSTGTRSPTAHRRAAWRSIGEHLADAAAARHAGSDPPRTVCSTPILTRATFSCFPTGRSVSSTSAPSAVSIRSSRRRSST